MKLASSRGHLIIKNGKLATNCCCTPYVIATKVLPDDSTWDLSPYMGPGIATQGGDYWRVAEQSWGWGLLSGCVEDDGSLNGISKEFDNSVEEGIELPVMYGGAFVLEIGCWSGDLIIWPA